LVALTVGCHSINHHVAHDGDEPPLGSEKVLTDAMGHVGSLLDDATLMSRCYRAAPRFSKRAPTRQGAAAGPTGGRETTDVRTFFFGSLVLIAD
jgi:hypothetical protein